MRGIVKSLAKCVHFDVSSECGLLLSGSFEYEDGGGQGFGCGIDAAFLIRFMRVFGVQKLQKVNGRSCWVTHDDSKIYRVEPLHKKDGTPFDIDEWIEWTNRRCVPISPYEMETGKMPPSSVFPVKASEQ